MTRIEDYAMLGDLHTAALVSNAGSVDWLCLPHFDSPACFAALLDGPEAGRWLLAPAGAQICTTRRYRAGTLVLETEWTTPQGRVRVIDFMPPRVSYSHVIRVPCLNRLLDFLSWNNPYRLPYHLEGSF